MQRIMYILFGLMFLVSNIFIVGCGTIPLQFDGMYQSEKEDEYWGYVRFYKDNTVITVSSTGNPAEVFRWFKKENIKNINLSNGLYTIKNDILIFSSTDKYGTVDYEGKIQGDTIILNWYSHINSNRRNSKYYFVKLSEK
jgi:hypothetical protein